MLKLTLIISLPLLFLIGLAALLPRNSGDFLPPNLEPITAANAHRVQELAILGRGTPRDIAWSSDGRTLAVATTIGIWLYDFDPNSPASIQDVEPRLLRAHRTEVHTIAFSPDSTLLASAGEGNDYGMVYLWDIASGQPLQVLHENEGAVTDIAFGRDGALLITGLDAQLWDTSAVLDGGEPVLVARNHTNTWIFTAALSPNGKMAALRDNDGTLHLWDIERNTVQNLFEGQTPFALRMAFSPDGRVLAYDMQGVITLYDIANGNTLAAVDTRTGTNWPGVSDLEFDPPNHLLAFTSTEANPLTVWNIENLSRNGDTLNTLPLATAFCCFLWSPERIAFHPNASILASADRSQTVVLWDITTGRPLTQLDFNQRFTNATFDERGGIVTAREEDDERISWDIATGAQIPPDETWSLLPHRTSFLDPQIAHELDFSSRAYEAFNPQRTLHATYDEYSSELQLLDNLQNPLMVAHYSPLSFISDIAVSQKYLVLGEFFGEVTVWDTELVSDVPMFMLELSESSAQVAINMDATILATGGHGGNLTLRDLQTGAPLIELHDHAELTEGSVLTIANIAFHSNGRLMLTAASDGTVRLWGILV
jgi:WD40 repeat protein